MIRILPTGFAVLLAIALLPQGAPVAEAAKARGMTMHNHGPSWGKGGRPTNFSGTQKRQGIGLILPAVQKIRDYGGGGGGGGGKPKPKPKEDCMSCAD